MTSYSVLVVEDESIVSKDIQQSLKKFGYSIAGTCAKAEDAVTAAATLTPDIILMDIMLKGPTTGIEAAETIRKTNNIPTVFLTAYADDDTLSKAKNAEPFGYVLKPFKEIELHSAIEMAMHKHQKFSELAAERDELVSKLNRSQDTPKEVLFVKHNSRIVRVDFSDIYFVEALKDYVAINTETTKYIVHSTMKDIEKKLNNRDFIRAHRSFIVRTDKVVAIEEHHLILKNDKKVIPVGGLYKHKVYDCLNLI